MVLMMLRVSNHVTGSLLKGFSGTALCLFHIILMHYCFQFVLHVLILWKKKNPHSISEETLITAFQSPEDWVFVPAVSANESEQPEVILINSAECFSANASTQNVLIRIHTKKKKRHKYDDYSVFFFSGRGFNLDFCSVTSILITEVMTDGVNAKLNISTFCRLAQSQIGRLTPPSRLQGKCETTTCSCLAQLSIKTKQ